MKDLGREADRWWQQSLSDFDFLPVARQAGKHDTCCFLAQQTAEKALKAYLFHQGEELILTHSIFKLCDMAAQYNPDFTALRERVKLKLATPTPWRTLSPPSSITSRMQIRPSLWPRRS